MSLTLRVFSLLIVLFVITSCRDDSGSNREEKKLIYFQSSTDARTSHMIANRSHIESLPFDGIAINIPASWFVMRPGARLDFNDVMRFLAPIHSEYKSMTHNFLQAYVDAAADPFDDWTSVIQNWTILAKASRDAGLIGILFDNEEYFGKIWEYPAQAKYKNLSLEAYAAQWRLRGRETMAAMAAVWPTVRIIHLHGPYASEPRSPREVTRQSGADRHDMRGHFFVGMVEGAPATARVIDGGETYALRSPEEFARHYQWRKHGIAELEPSSLIPPELRPSWPAKVDVAFGVYDRPYDGASMSPAILTRTLRNALARTDEYVWLFVEGQGPNNFLRSDGIEPWWIEAVRDAR